MRASTLLLRLNKAKQYFIQSRECITVFTAFSVDIYVSDMRYGRCDGNAIDEVKQSADIVIGSNDENGIARYLMDSVL